MLIRSGTKCIKGDFDILTQFMLVLQRTETMPFPRFAEAETNKKISGRVYMEMSRNLDGYRVSIRTRKQVEPMYKIKFGGMEKVRLVFKYSGQQLWFILSMQSQLTRRLYAPSRSSIYMDCRFVSNSSSPAASTFPWSNRKACTD
jgi:hypothetical protein